MNKADLVDNLVNNHNYARKDAMHAVDTVIDSISDALKNGENITLMGFGTFSVKRSAARTGRNPKTGETVAISARNTPAFKASAQLKKAVNS